MLSRTQEPTQNQFEFRQLFPSNRWFGICPKPPITLCGVFTRTPRNGVSSGVRRE